MVLRTYLMRVKTKGLNNLLTWRNPWRYTLGIFLLSTFIWRPVLSVKDEDWDDKATKQPAELEEEYLHTTSLCLLIHGPCLWHCNAFVVDNTCNKIRSAKVNCGIFNNIPAIDPYSDNSITPIQGKPIHLLQFVEGGNLPCILNSLYSKIMNIPNKLNGDHLRPTIR